MLPILIPHTLGCSLGEETSLCKSLGLSFWSHDWSRMNMWSTQDHPESFSEHFFFPLKLGRTTCPLSLWLSALSPGLQNCMWLSFHAKDPGKCAPIWMRWEDRCRARGVAPLLLHLWVHQPLGLPCLLPFQGLVKEPMHFFFHVLAVWISMSLISRRLLVNKAQT